MEIYILIWLVLCCLVAYYADTKGQGAVGFFFFSLLLSPILGLIMVMIAVDKAEIVRMRDGKLAKCHFCAELVKTEAIKCKHCGSDLSSIRPTDY